MRDSVKIGRVVVVQLDDGSVNISTGMAPLTLSADDVQDLLVALDAVSERAEPKHSAGDIRERVIGGAMELRRQIYAATGDPVTVTIGMHGGVFANCLDGRMVTQEQLRIGEFEVDSGIILRRNRW